jgi:tetratricopeptide (TPR) repeat protein
MPQIALRIFIGRYWRQPRNHSLQRKAGFSQTEKKLQRNPLLFYLHEKGEGEWLDRVSAALSKKINYCKEHIMYFLPNFLDRKGSCLKQTLSCLGMLYFCVACAVSTPEAPAAVEKVTSGNDQPVQEEDVGTNDRACSYFYFLWGSTAENNNRFDEALEAYEKALLCDGDSEYIKRGLALLLIRMDRRNQAADILEQIISKNPQDIENRLLLAKVYTSLGQEDKAIDIYKGILAIREDHDTLLLLGTLYVQNKEYDEAQKILNRLVKVEGDSYLAYYSLARLYRELQLYDKAAAAYEKALELNWFEQLAYELAEFYEDQLQYDKAIALYQRIIEEGESTDMAKTRLVNLYLKIDENDKALELLRELRTDLPESFNVDITIIRILLNQEKYDEAIMILEDVLRTNPELTVMRYLLGMAYYKKNEPAKAIEQLKIIPPESNLYEDSIFLRIKILNEAGDTAGAIELLNMLISDAATRKPSYYIMLASLLRERQEIEHGREIYDQGVRQYPKDAELLYNYGLFLEKIGEQKNAMARMEEVLTLDPENGPALNYVGYTWADNGVNLDKALEYIKKAVELMPDDGYVRDSLGWVYFKMGNSKQAVIELEKASDMVAEDPVIREHLGDAYLQANEPEKALASYEESYKLYEDQDKKNNVAAKINSLKAGGTR